MIRGRGRNEEGKRKNVSEKKTRQTVVDLNPTISIRRCHHQSFSLRCCICNAWPLLVVESGEMGHPKI
jgi:hypothetical protein